MEGRLPRKLAAILYADVAGYSRLTGDDEDATHRTLSEHLDLVAAGVDSLGGTVMHYAGDAVLAQFDAVLDAVAAAVEIQKNLASKNQPVSSDRKVEFRIGVNLGDVIEDRGDIYGDGVNVAARLEALAEPGGICVSAAVRTAVGKRLGLAYKDLGELKVKNIEEPVRAYTVLMEELAVSSETNVGPEPELADKPSIAVLPFDCTTAAEFADGLSNDLITDLDKFGRFTIAAAHSSFAYKGHSTSVQQVASELNVQYVLEGRVQWAGNRARISAQLSDGTSGQQVWAERYQREVEDVFELQDELVETISASLTHKLDSIEASKKAIPGSPEQSAQDLYMKGREVFFARTKESNIEAKRHMTKAIELDHGFARAYGFLAWLHVHDYRYGWSDNPQESLDLALDASLTALELAPSDYETHWRLGITYLYRGQFEKAMSEYGKARERNPNHAGFLAEMAGALILTGQVNEAVSQLERAMRINPNYPEWFLAQLGWALYEQGRYQDAFNTLDKINRPPAVFLPLIIVSLVELRRIEAAKKVGRELLSQDPNFSLRNLKFWPYEDHTKRDRLVENLRIAGIPE